MKTAAYPAESGVSRLHSRLVRSGIAILLLLAFLAVFLLLFFQFRSATFQSITAANDSFGDYVDSVLELTNASIRTSAMQMFYTSSVRAVTAVSGLACGGELLSRCGGRPARMPGLKSGFSLNFSF